MTLIRYLLVLACALAVAIAVAITMALAPPAAMAQTAAETVTEFPPGAQALSPEALSAALADRRFSMVYSSMVTLRLDFKTRSGWVFATAGSVSDSGQWRTEGSTLCIQFQQRFPSSCSEIRAMDGDLYMKRSTGQIVKMEPQ